MIDSNNRMIAEMEKNTDGEKNGGKSPVKSGGKNKIKVKARTLGDLERFFGMSTKIKPKGK